jgi:deoxycytidylate deaminase
MRKKYQISAIIYDKKGRILSVGENSYIKTHPIQAQYAKKVHEPKKQFLHAEIDAIIKCRNLEKAHKMVVIRPTSYGFGASKPCAVCALAISKTNIKHILYHE